MRHFSLLVAPWIALLVGGMSEPNITIAQEAAVAQQDATTQPAKSASPALPDLPQANVSHHLAIMRERGLVNARKDGQFVYYSLTTLKIVEAVDLLREVMALHYDEAVV